MKSEEDIKRRIDDFRSASRKANSKLFDIYFKDIIDELRWVLEE